MLTSVEHFADMKQVKISICKLNFLAALMLTVLGGICLFFLPFSIHRKPLDLQRCQQLTDRDNEGHLTGGENQSN